MIDVFFVSQNIMAELFVFNVAKRAHQCGVTLVGVDFPIAENICHFHDFIDETEAFGVVGRQIVSIGKMERINVVFGRGIFRLNQFQRFAVSG